MAVLPNVTSLSGEVSIHRDSEELAAAAARWLNGVCERAVAATRSFSIALAGGGTPRQLYELLAKDPWNTRIAWGAWHVFFGDERACPPNDEASNYHMARTTLLDHVPVPAGQIYRMPADRDDLDGACDEYASVLGAVLASDEAGIPRFDCVLLGLGENGHTASLFPGTPALEVFDRWVTRGRADYPPFDRMTLTFPVINAARAVAFLVNGASKRQALVDTASGTAPATRVRPANGALLWFIDAAAAGSASA